MGHSAQNIHFQYLSPYFSFALGNVNTFARQIISSIAILGANTSIKGRNSTKKT